MNECTHIVLTVNTQVGELAVCRPEKGEIAKIKDVAKSIFLEAFSTTYRGYHQASQSSETIENWLRIKEGISFEDWLNKTFDDEYADYENGKKQFIHLYKDKNLIGWLSHSPVSETGEIYLSQCSLEASFRGQRVAKTIFQEVLQEQSTLNTILPGVKVIKLIARKINVRAESLYMGVGFTQDLTIDPSQYGESYDERYVGYRLTTNHI